MTDRWDRIDKLFHEVADMSPEERQAYLQRECQDDPELAKEVEALVAFEKGAVSFLDKPALGTSLAPLADQLAAEQPDDALIGQTIGPYRLIEKIAIGGMGVVYRAERADHEYEHQVAIKLIKRGMDSEQILQRFRQERQTLANLNHVNIARLLGGGATDDGRPYLVMEYIDGRPIDRYCDEHRLSIQQRLILFEAVCGAVHYAHQNLVVHRDLKPANILVTKDGVPKLLDFGVAKVLSDDRATAVRTITSMESRLLTPEYASPEQILGQPMTTASDVYSLGVTLYQLLTGHLPYNLRHRPPSDIERMVCIQDPERPSTATNRVEELRTDKGELKQRITPDTVSKLRNMTADSLKRRLRGDLDNIVMMAMRKDPERRYSSVEQLAGDLRKYREGRPVLAQRDTIRYRTAKFLRRNKVGVAAFSLVVLSLLIGVIGIAYEARATRRQRDVAQAHLARAEEAEKLAKSEAATAKHALEFLKGVFQNPDPIPGRSGPVTAREILDIGARRLQEELLDQPEIRATLLDNIGWAYMNLGLLPRAHDLLDEALDLRLEIYGEENLDVAESLNSLGEWHRRTGGLEESAAMQRRVLQIHRRLLDSGDERLARSLSNLALTLLEAGQFADAEPLLDEALSMTRGESEEWPAVKRTEARSILLNNVGGLRFESGRYEEAEPLFREAIEVRRDVHGEKHPAVATAMHNLGKTLLMRGHEDEAEKYLQQALDMRLELLDSNHPEVATTLHWLARLACHRGDFQLAHHRITEALSIRRVKLPANNPQITESQILLGSTLVGLHRFEEAEESMLSTYRILEQAGDDRTGRASEAAGVIADLYDAWDKPDQAKEWREKTHDAAGG